MVNLNNLINNTLETLFFSNKNPNNKAEISPKLFPIPEIICPYLIDSSWLISCCLIQIIRNSYKEYKDI
jgi:hypothetical protein